MRKRNVVYVQEKVNRIRRVLPIDLVVDSEYIRRGNDLAAAITRIAVKAFRHVEEKRLSKPVRRCAVWHAKLL